MTTKTKKTKITTPVPGFTGDGPGTLKFKDGVGYTTDPAVIEYCRSRGYGIGSDEPNSHPLNESEQAALREYFQLAAKHFGGEMPDDDELEDLDPVKVRELLAQPFDPRLLVDGGIIVVGTPLRDAAVDPQPGDFMVPTHAGEANPHGPLVNAPGIHGSGNVPLKPGPVEVENPAAQEQLQTEHAEQILTEGKPVEQVLTGWESDSNPEATGDRGPLGLSDPGSAPAGEQTVAFDPAEHTVEQVNGYLDAVLEDDTDGYDAAVTAVLEAEGKGKQRAGILTGPHAPARQA